MPPGIGSSGGGVCSNRYGVAENVGYMNDVAISYGYFSPGIIFLTEYMNYTITESGDANSWNAYIGNSYGCISGT